MAAIDELTGSHWGFARKLMWAPKSSPRENIIRYELEASKKLLDLGNHASHVVKVYCVGTLQQRPDYSFIDMELCCMDLAWCPWPESIRGKSPYFDIDVQTSSSINWKIMAGITSGLDFIHSQDLVHRDLKPANST